ncbi:hypothetical protein Tco_0196081 [Tanacetum coccineum]
MGTVKGCKTKTLDETIELSIDFDDRKLLNYAERHSMTTKRRADDSSETTINHITANFKGRYVTSLQHGDRRNRKPYGVTCQVQTSASPPQWPVHTEVAISATSRALVAIEEVMVHKCCLTLEGQWGQLLKEMVVLSAEHQDTSKEIVQN